MPVMIGKKPEHDFTDPVGMLADCHRRIERFLTLLIEMSAQAGTAELTADQGEALGAALNYFKKAAPKHTADEEESLFPRLQKAAAAANNTAALARLNSLHADHQEAEALHNEVEQLGRAGLTAGHLTADCARRLAAALARLQTIYHDHIAMEEAEIFTLARQLLSAAEIEAIGVEMAARRGVAFPARS